MKLIDETPYWFCCGSTDSMKHADSCKESKLYNPDCKWGTLKHHLNFNAYYEEEATFTTETWEIVKTARKPTQRLSHAEIGKLLGKKGY